MDPNQNQNQPTTGTAHPAPTPRPRPQPVQRPRITLEQFEKLVARINASSSLPQEAKDDIIKLVAAIYGFQLHS